MLAAGSRRRSLEVASEAAVAVQGEGDPGGVAWYGMLHLQCALASASLGQSSDVHLAEAKGAAGHRPADLWMMEFTAANVATWESAAALERGDYNAAPGIVNRVDRGGRTNQRRVAC